MTAAVASSALVNAFANVPRERFLGAPPWRFSSGVSLQLGAYRGTNDIRDLYHDVLVVLKSEKFLNNGQPSMIARFLEALDLTSGNSVIHIGCGTGYYTAIMAEVIGVKGYVLALDVDPELAAEATDNLGQYPNITVFHRDGAALKQSSADVILVNAGVTHLHPIWLASLKDGGRLVAPFLVGRTPFSRDAVALRIVRKGQRFQAELVTVLSIFPSSSQHDPDIQALLNASFESNDLRRLRSVRIDLHDRTDSCIVHTSETCLSAEACEPITGGATNSNTKAG